MMRSNVVPLIFLALALSLFGAIAWLSHHPESEFLDQARTWPWIGPALGRLQDAYLPPASSTDPTADGPSLHSQDGVTQDEAIQSGNVDVVYVTPPRPPWQGSPDYVWALADTPLYRQPADSSRVLLTFDAITRLARLERRGDWFRVWRDGIEGWVHLPGYRDDGEPPYGNDPDPPGPLMPRKPDEAKLALAREMLRQDERILDLGPYRLYTDSQDHALIERLAVVARQIESAYAARHDLEPLGEPAAAVVLFAQETAYRILQLRSQDIAGLSTAGHNSHGVVATYISERQTIDVVSTLIHEIVHLLNRRSLGPALPPWLDEGICEDLATSLVDSTGQLHPQILGGRQQTVGTSITLEGGFASLWHVRERILQGDLTSIAHLTRIDSRQFVRHESRLRYDLAALWVRYLVDGEDGRYRASWQTFLQHVANGGVIDAGTLESHIGLPLVKVQADFHSWVLKKSARPAAGWATHGRPTD